ncbi:hypothetical protein [Aquimarina aggregata]|uniref:hypothetical protein n=1 Tax=Aquimarina aggregata TaxID=1642818 RepID=UPI000AAA8BD5|nr:hypothetical protein [Aquimarina aggregata]
MKNGRLSLDAFKAKADKIETNEILEKVQGGEWGDCHGYLGAVSKFISSDYCCLP